LRASYFEREVTVSAPKKTSKGTNQDPLKETPTDQELDRIADEVAEKASKTEQRLDEERGEFTK
jgi:hypothetical protein